MAEARLDHPTLDETSTNDDPGLREGSVVAEKYFVGGLIGAGGMALVYEATNLELDERVALKLIRPEVRASAKVAARFRAEARSAARIRNEHVARVYDVVSTPEGHPVIVMELLTGRDLGALFQARQLPTLDVLTGWMIEACEGLAAAHAQGVVHRDVKPENLFLLDQPGGRPTVKLLDFGISKAVLTSAGSSNAPGLDTSGGASILGTPTYMSPEQIKSANAADPKIDVWSLGVVAYEAIAGRPPFLATDPVKTCRAILDDEPPPLRSLAPHVPPELADIIHACLSKDPERRPNTGELAVRLLPFSRERHSMSVDRIVSMLRTAGIATVDIPLSYTPATGAPSPFFSGPPIATPAEPPRRSAKGKIAAALLLLVAVLTGLLLFFRSREQSTAAEGPTRSVASEPPRAGPTDVTPTKATAAPTEEASPTATARSTATPSPAPVARGGGRRGGPVSAPPPTSEPVAATPPAPPDPQPSHPTSNPTVKVIGDEPSGVKIIQ